jgi:hypothetical protein
MKRSAFAAAMFLLVATAASSQTLTGRAAGIGLFLALNYGLATQWMSFGQQGFHLLLVTSMLILLGSWAGRVWGMDHLLLRGARRCRLLRWLA